MVINVATIKRQSTVNGPGYRYTIYAQGCPHNCKGCLNPETQNFKDGTEYEVSEIIEDLKSNNLLLTGTTFTGEEPFLQPKSFHLLARKINFLLPRNDLIIYTGCYFEDLLDDFHKHKLVQTADIIIDGKYDKSKTNIKNRYKRTDNQRIINVKTSLKALKEDGQRITIWTCRVGKYLEKAKEMLDEKGIEYDAINDNSAMIEEEIAFFGCDKQSRKISASKYIDDKAVEFKDNWKDIRKRLID